MARLDQILRCLEEHIDLEHLAEVKEKLQTNLSFEMIQGRVPLRILFPAEDFQAYSYGLAFQDLEKMLFNELIPIYNSTLVRDDSLPMIRANYGVGIIPSIFGLPVKVLNNDLPWVEHLNDLDKVKRLIDDGVPDFKTGLGAKVFESHAYFLEQLAAYPKCRQAITIYHPDLQGPFSLASSIWGPDIYFAVYDHPELLHALLKLVTETYIRLMMELKKSIPDDNGHFVYHWGTLFKGCVVLRNDTAVTLSKEMYEEFVKPYDQQILKAFTGGSMHFCGRADQWISSLMESEDLGALNFGQPPNLVFGFDFLEQVSDQAKAKQIAIVDYIMPKETAPEILKSKYQTGITYQINVSSKKEALELADQWYKG